MFSLAKKTIFAFFWVATFSLPAFAQVEKLFPYEVDFTEAEKKVLNQLDPETLKKLLQVAKLLKEKGGTSGSTQDIGGSAGASSQNGNTNQQQNPFLGNQNNPYLQQAGASNAFNNSPYGPNGMFSQYYGGNQNYSRYNDMGSGYDLSMQALGFSDFGKLGKLGSGNENCQGNFGVNGNMGGTTARLQFDTSRICQAFGRRIKVVDAKRACNGPSRHCFGEAMDFTIRAYGDRKEQALMVVVLIALGYNIGSYTTNFPLHADHQEAGGWKTWSGVEHTNYQGSNARPYDLAVRDAMNLLGFPVNSAQEFRARFGRPSKQEMMKRAQDALSKLGNSEFSQFGSKYFTPGGN